MKKATLAIKMLFLVLMILCSLFPVYWMLTMAVRNAGELRSGLNMLPQSVTGEHFQTLFFKYNFLYAVKNSLFVSITSVLLSTAMGIMCAYVLAKLRLKYALRGTVLLFSFLVRILPPIAFAVPLYIMMNKIGILQTKIPIILSYILLNLPLTIWFMIDFFQSVPPALDESAKIDGAGETTIFMRIFIPMVLPGIGAVSILSFISAWNEYLFAVIFVQSPAMFTIPISLSVLNSEQELTQWGTVASGGAVSMIPILLFVLFAQNLLINGLTSGSVKE